MNRTPRFTLPQRIPGASGINGRPSATPSTGQPDRTTERLHNHLSEDTMYPTVDDVLTACSGRFDPQHPHADILRGAWLLARMSCWYNPREIAAKHGSSHAGQIGNRPSSTRPRHCPLAPLMAAMRAWNEPALAGGVRVAVGAFSAAAVTA